jgi:ferredoxin
MAGIYDRVFGAGLAAAAALTLVALPAIAQTAQSIIVTVPGAPKLGDPPEASNMRLVGYNDLQSRSAYQPTIHHQGGRYIAYVGHHGGTPEAPKPVNTLTGQPEFNGTSIIDVTDPAHPQYLAHIPGTEGTYEDGGALYNSVPGIVGECGGACSCATCRCYVDAAWMAKVGGTASSAERDLLMGAENELKPNARLSCQITMTPELDGLIVHLPEKQY